MLALLNLVPKWVWLAIVAALSATSCKLKLENGQLSIEVEKHATKIARLETNIARLETNIAISNQQAAEQAARNQATAREAERAAASRQAALRRDAAVAATELERLRVALSTYTSPRLYAAPASIAPGIDNPDPIPELFLDCSRRYIELAGKADGHASDVKTLIDAWPLGPTPVESGK